MLLRILLIVAILAGVGVVAISHFQLRPHIQGIIDEREKQRTRAETSEKAHAKTTKTLKDTEATLSSTKKQLTQTQNDLAATKTQVENEQKRANDLKQNLDKTREDLRSAQQELSAWKNLLVPVEQVAAIITSEKKLKADLEVLQDEKKILVVELERRQKIIDEFRKGGDDVEFPLPKIAKVLAVDPKWNFVVLNVGSRQNVTNNCVGLVSRNGKLVAKVRVTSVEPDKSIANVKPGWELDQIQEGDLVLPPF